MRRRVCVFTGSRSDYGRLKSVMEAINRHDRLELQLIVGGTHLIEKHGQTIDQIVEDGFTVDRRIFTIVEGETLETMTKSVGLTNNELATAFQNLKPDVVVVHGDRFEVLGAAIAAAMMNVPFAHIEGGEVTGSIDESIRHAITKFAHIHFASNEDSKNRILRLGEDPNRVFNVGCPMVDTLLKTPLIPREELLTKHPVVIEFTRIRYDPQRPFLLILFHPDTWEYGKGFENTKGVFNAVVKTGMQVLWLWPNADAGSREIVNSLKVQIKKSSNKNSIGFYRNFPVNIFVNLLWHTACLVGNSSVGFREACYFGTPVVDVGKRQDGRIQTKNIINVTYNASDIAEVILKQCRHGKYEVEKVYGEGNSGEKIADILANIDLQDIRKKITY